MTKLRFTPTRKWQKLRDELEALAGEIPSAGALNLTKLANDLNRDKIPEPFRVSACRARVRVVGFVGYKDVRSG